MQYDRGVHSPVRPLSARTRVFSSARFTNSLGIGPARTASTCVETFITRCFPHSRLVGRIHRAKCDRRKSQSGSPPSVPFCRSAPPTKHPTRDWKVSISPLGGDDLSKLRKTARRRTRIINTALAELRFHDWRRTQPRTTDRFLPQAPWQMTFTTFHFLIFELPSTT